MKIALDDEDERIMDWETFSLERIYDRLDGRDVLRELNERLLKYDSLVGSKKDSGLE